MNTMDTTPQTGAQRHPPFDAQALEQGDTQALAAAMAHMAAVDVALLPAPQAALLAAGVELCELLARSPQGRKALHDFGFKPVFQNVERE